MSNIIQKALIQTIIFTILPAVTFAGRTGYIRNSPGFIDITNLLLCIGILGFCLNALLNIFRGKYQSFRDILAIVITTLIFSVIAIMCFIWNLKDLRWID